jgi:hypothetical protein
MRRLQKKHPATTMEPPAPDDHRHADMTPPATPSSPDASTAPPPDGETQLSAATRPSSLDSPRLVNASSSGAADDFSDFVHQISFSKRGSIMLGGRRPSRRPDEDNDDAAAAAAARDTMADTMAMVPPRDLHRSPPRVFPLRPSPMPKTPVSESPAPASEPVTFVVEEEEEESVVSPNSCSAVSPKSSVPMTATTTDAPPHTPSPTPSPKTLRHSASTRLVPIDMERESQKVRSLYEPEGLRWEDGGQDEERLEPTREEDSCGTDEIDAYGFL